MSDFASALEVWNKWLVIPALGFCALIAAVRMRHRSLFSVAAGVALWLLGTLAFEQPRVFASLAAPAAVRLVGLTLTIIGLVVGLSGLVWFGVNYVRISKPNA